MCQPLVLAHVNGFDVLGADLSSVYPRSSTLKVAQKWLHALSAVTGLPCFLAGEFAEGPRLAVAPVPVTVDSAEVARTPAQRRNALRNGAAF
eukprot:2179671-Pleurochrysis_carterae.AAC.1